MNADANSPIIATGFADPRRSRRSLDFEALWRSLPRQTTLPHRRDFNPARAGSLLRDIMLVEMRLEGQQLFPVRLAGSATVEKIQRDPKGHDYLEFMPPEYHAGLIDTASLMVNRPCGLWQITPLHFERGIAQCFEVTVFPLLGDPSPFALALLAPRDEFIRPIAPGGRLMLAETAREFEFLDIGAGVPVWPPSAASETARSRMV